MTKDQPGQEVVLDRLLDLVVIAALRSWLSIGSEKPGMLGSRHDPLVRTALTLAQDDPAGAWTVATLASGRRLQGGLCATVHQCYGNAADGLLDRMATRAGCGPAPRTGKNNRIGRPRCGLRECFRAEYGLQANPGCQPTQLPSWHQSELSRVGALQQMSLRRSGFGEDYWQAR